MRDADIEATELAAIGTMAHQGVCPLCEENLTADQPAEGPYHAECLAESIR